MPESRANRGPRELTRSPELDTQHHMQTSNDDDHRAVGTPYRDRQLGELGTEATRRRRRQRRNRRSSTKRGCFPHPKQKGTAEPPPRMQKQPQLPYSMTAPRDEDPQQVHKKPGGARTTGGNAEAALPTNRGVTAAYISETTGGWVIATVTTPSRSSRPARQPLSPDRERTEERSDRTRDR